MKPRILIAMAAALASATLALAATIVPAEAGRSGTLTIGSLTMHVGEEGTVDIRALYLEAPGLGAWTFDVVRDPDIVSTVACDGADIGVCGPEFSPESDRVTGASQHGLEGTVTLAHFTFRCDREGESHLSFEINVWASADYEDHSSDLEVVDGSVTCEARAGVTAPQTVPTATPAIAFPRTGNAGGGSTNAFAWPVAALSVLGTLALIASAGFARRRCL